MKRIPKNKNEVDFYGPTSFSLTSTKALPGTIEKIDTMVLRAENNECLWHPDDAIDTPDIIADILEEYDRVRKVNKDMDKDDAMRLARNNVSLKICK